MSEGGEIDLSGRWNGFYNYPDGSPPTGFEAVIRDTGGLISGITTEPGDSPDCFGMILQAVIEGRRDGASVRFTKMYDYLERAADIVHYDGVVQADGDEIEGTWDIHNDWSGTFLMVRAGTAGESVEENVSEEV